MELKIKEIEPKIIEVIFGKDKIEISIQSEKWNNKGINDFLIKLASSTPDDEDVKITYDKDNKNEIYNYICELFESFKDEYNKNR